MYPPRYLLRCQKLVIRAASNKEVLTKELKIEVIILRHFAVLVTNVPYQVSPASTEAQPIICNSTCFPIVFMIRITCRHAEWEIPAELGARKHRSACADISQQIKKKRGVEKDFFLARKIPFLCARLFSSLPRPLRRQAPGLIEPC